MKELKRNGLFNFLQICLCAVILITAGSLAAKEEQGKSQKEYNQKIEIGLNLLEIFKSSGKEDDPKYADALKSTKNKMYEAYLQGPNGSTMRMFWYCVRMDEILGKTFMGMKWFQKHLDGILAKSGKIALDGGLALVENWGALISYRSGTGVMLKYMGSDDGLLLIWGYNQKTKSFNPWRLYHTDKTGTREIYWYDGKSKRFRLHSLQRPLNFQVGFKKYRANALIPVSIEGPRTVVAYASGEAFAVTVNQKMEVTAAQFIGIKNELKRELRNLSRVPSFTISGGTPTALDPKDKLSVFPAVTDADKVKIKALLVEAGMPERDANLLSTNVAKPGDYIHVVGPAFYKGTPKALKKGNYAVAFFNRWDDDSTQALLAKFKKNKLNIINASDGAVFDRFRKNGYYSFTIRSNQPKRAYVTVYDEKGRQTESHYYLDDLGLKLSYDGNGTLLTESARLMFAGSNTSGTKKNPKNYAAWRVRTPVFHHEKLNYSQEPVENIVGIAIQNTGTKAVEYYSTMGKRLNKYDPWRIQVPVNFADDRQWRPLVIPTFGSNETRIVKPDRTVSLNSGLLYTDGKGILHLEVIKSTVTGTILKIVEQTYPETR
jgi:hypothetical protein